MSNKSGMRGEFDRAGSVKLRGEKVVVGICDIKKKGSPTGAGEPC